MKTSRDEYVYHGERLEVEKGKVAKCPICGKDVLVEELKPMKLVEDAPDGEGSVVYRFEDACEECRLWAEENRDG